MTRRYVPLVFSATWVTVHADTFHAAPVAAEIQFVTDHNELVNEFTGSVEDSNGGQTNRGEYEGKSLPSRIDVWCTSDSMCNVGYHCVSNKCRVSPEFNQPNSLRCKATMTTGLPPSQLSQTRRLFAISTPKKCIFPYANVAATSNGDVVEWYNECSTRPSLTKEEFVCPTTLDQYGHGQDWEICDCFAEEGDTCGLAVTQSGTPCMSWEGGNDEGTYHRCALEAGDSFKWCATTADGNGYYDLWDYCTCQCTKDHDCSVNEHCNNGLCEATPCRAQYTRDIRKCVYPYKFESDGDWRYSCSREHIDGDEDQGPHMWCATSLNPDGTYNTWDYCDCGTCDENLRGIFDVDYRGCQDHTVTGKKCQKWNAQYPHESLCYDSDNNYLAESGACAYDPTGLGEHNYCRNPLYQEGSHLTIWCYTTDPDVQWDYCTPKTDTFVGDPIITVNGHKTKVDLPHGHKTLMWKDAIVEIFSKADVMTPDGKNQWFSQFSVNVNGEEALQITTNFRNGVPDKTPDGEFETMLIASKGKSLAKLGKYDLGHNVKVEVTRQGQQEVVSVLSAGFSFSLASAQAKKFLPNVEKAKRYTHLDLQIRHMDDKMVKDGILAELYGFIPISLTTAGMISHISSMQ